MPRTKLNKENYYVADAIEELRWKCKRYGLTQKEQAELVGCTPQNLSKRYANRSLSLRQYLIIQKKLTEIIDKNQETTK